METSSSSKPATAGQSSMDSQLGLHSLQIYPYTVINSPLNSRDQPPSGANRLEKELKHAIPCIQAPEIKQIVQGSSASCKSISSLIHEHLSEVNQPIWSNLFNTVYHSDISKKQALFLIKSLSEFVRNRTDSDSQSKDFHRFQKRAILIGYTMLAILELQNQKDEGYLSPHQKYFAELKQKQLIKESIKIGAYISKMIEQSELSQGQTKRNCQSESLFSKFVDGLVGDRLSERRTMLIDWASIERMNRFSSTINSFAEQTVSNKPKLEIYEKQYTSQNVSVSTICKLTKQVAKQQVIQHQFPEYEKTSCNQSIASEPNSLQSLRKGLEDQIVSVDQENLGTVAEQNSNLEGAGLDEFHAHNVDAIDINQEGNQQPQQQVLCSTADTSNFYPEAMNQDNLPPILVVVENEDEIQDLTDIINPIRQEAAQQVAKPSLEVEAFEKEELSYKMEIDLLVENFSQKNWSSSNLFSKGSVREDRSLSCEHEPQLFIPWSNQPELTEKAISIEFKDSSDLCQFPSEKQILQRESGISVPNEQISENIEHSESERKDEKHENDRQSVPNEIYECPLASETLANDV